MAIWKIAPKIDQEFKNRFPEINPIILQLLWNRELKNQEQIDEFLLPDYSQDLHDPFLFKEMGKTVERIKQAIDQKEKITIYGDYDSDGVCSTTILYLTLQKMGADVSYFLPDREKEGYGLNMDAVNVIIDEGTKLIITVDCGITNIEEVEAIKKKGIDIIITDHHIPLDNLPQAFSIINAWVKNESYPFKELAGAGVAFKLVQALLRQFADSPESWKRSGFGGQSFQEKADLSTEVRRTKVEAFEKWLLDLVAIGSVADMVSLKGENRVLVKYGLVVLNKTSRAGLRQLIKKARINLGEIDTRSIGFQISSRLNAAGRVDHANIALEMLIAREDKKALELSDKLQKLNELRQKMMEKIFNEATQEIEEKNENIIISYKKDWPTGLLGITAHRLVDLYARPSLVITIRPDQIKGCGRSLENFNLIEFLKKFEDYFVRYGGHAGAAGFTLKENSSEFLKDFCQKIKEVGRIELKDFDFRPATFVDAEIKMGEIDWPFFEELTKFEPFGENNPPPVFLAKDLIIKNIKKVGKNDKHLKITTEEGKNLIYFDGGETLNKEDLGKKIDILFEIGDNQWNGTREMEYRVLDLKVH